jgi:hypothetical protein
VEKLFPAFNEQEAYVIGTLSESEVRVLTRARRKIVLNLGGRRRERGPEPVAAQPRRRSVRAQLS